MTTNQSDFILSRDELTALIGSPRKARQFAWLRERGIPAEAGLDGRPRVLRDAVAAVMMPGASRKAKMERPRLELLRVRGAA